MPTEHLTETLNAYVARLEARQDAVEQKLDQLCSDTADSNRVLRQMLELLKRIEYRAVRF